MERLSRWTAFRPRLVVTVGLITVMVFAAFGGPLPGLLKAGDDFDDPGSRSAAARTAVARATGPDAWPGLVAIVPTPGGLRDAAARADVAAVAQRLRGVDGVARVATPAPGDPAMVARDGSSALVTGVLKDGAGIGVEDVPAFGLAVG